RNPARHVDRSDVYVDAGARAKRAGLTLADGDGGVRAGGRPRGPGGTDPLATLDVVVAHCGQVQGAALTGARRLGSPVLRMDAAYPRLEISRNDLNQSARRNSARKDAA